MNFPEPLTFPKPIGPDLKAELLFKTMYRGPHSTNETVRTKTADDVQKLHTVKSGKRHLTELRRAKQLWRNLINYADMDPNANHLATCTDRPQFSDIPEPLDLPQAQEQLSGVFELWRWFQRHSLDDAATVTSEDAVQDEIVKQVVEFLNSLIKTRYGNRSTVSDPWPKLPPMSYLPGEPKDSRNVCIAEVKPFWAYSDQDFDTVLTNGTARGGRFGWRSKKKKDKAYVLIKQKWGEMIFYDRSPSDGIFTTTQHEKSQAL
ncbi:hypothetical protein A0H81_06130 [Grifola frondosa]|uniref:Uncharacterized protein n=1 Tax=Grifola frondosa TaxID=5627 RepID=A0A1C7MFJ9_GRIFR|nr:hypothetical protein A0H81_06130 [Grifola frondosa]